MRQTRSPRLSRRTVVLSAAVTMALGASSALAQSTWDGGGADDNLGTAANWVGDVAPVFGGAANSTTTALVFDGTTRTSINNNVSGAAAFTQSITFAPTAGAFVFSGNTFTLGNAPSIVQNSDRAQAFAGVATGSTPLTFSGTGYGAVSLNSFSNTGSTTNFSFINNAPAPVSVNALTLSETTTVKSMTFTGTGTTRLGTVSSTASSGTLTLNSGRVIISGDNSAFAGLATSVGGSTLGIGSNTALGGGTLSLNIGSFYAAGGNRTISNPISLSNSSAGLAAVFIGSNNLSVPSVTRATSGTNSMGLYNAGTGTLTIGTLNNSSGSASGSIQIFFGGSGNFAITGGIANKSDNTVATNFLYQGSGQITLSGPSTYTGTTGLSAGTVSLNYTTDNTRKLSNAGVLTLGGASIEQVGGSFAESVASTTINAGQNSISRPSGTASFNLGAITFSTGSGVGGGLNVATNASVQTTTTNSNGRISPRLTVGGANWGKNDGSNNIVALAAGDYSTYASTGLTNTVNYLLTGSGSVGTGGATPGSLKIDTTGAGQSLTLGGNTLTVSQGLLFVGSNDYSITGGNFAAGAYIFQHWGSGTLTIGATRTSNLTQEKFGTGKLVLTGTSNVNQSTAMIINAGQVQIDSNAAIGLSGTDFGNQVILNGGTLVADTSGGSFSTQNAGGVRRNLNLSPNGGGIDVIGGGTFTVTGQIAVPSATTNAGPLRLGSASTDGTIALNSARTNAFVGGVVIGGGTVRLDAPQGAAVSVSGTSTNGSAVVTLTSVAGLVVGQPISGANIPSNNTIVAIDTVNNTVTVSGTVTTGTTGTVTTTSAGPLGLSPTGFPNLPNYISFTGGTLQHTSTNTNDYSARIANSSSAIKLDTNGQRVVYASRLDETNVGGLTKLGSGTLVLSGANEYSGPTTVSAGTLLVSSHTATDAGSAYTVSATSGTATLGGTGSVAAGVTVGSNGIIAPGGDGTNGARIDDATTGGFAVGSLTVNTGAKLAVDFTIDTTTPSNSKADVLVNNGSFTSNAPLTLDFSFLSTVAGGVSPTQSFVILSNVSDTTVVNLSMFNAPTFPGVAYTVALVDGDAGLAVNDLQITFTQVPEPASVGLLGLALAGLGARRNRRRR
jgi:autotransporter-associated beta strand protein